MTYGYLLPPGWSWTTLGAVASIQGGIQKGKKRRGDELLRSVAYLRVANVQRGFLDLREVLKIEATEAEIERLLLLPGDVLFNEGGDRDKLGRGWIWRGEVAECIHQNHVFRARMDGAALLPAWVSQWGNTEGQRYFLTGGKQTTNLASLNKTTLSALPLPVPPLNEQRRIVDKVDALFAHSKKAKASLDRIPALLEKLKKSVLAAAFRGDLTKDWREAHPDVEPADKLLERIRIERRRRWEEAELAKMRAKGKEPKNDKWKEKYLEPKLFGTKGLPDLPRGWAWVGLQDLGEVSRGKSKHRPRNDPRLFGKKMPFIQTGDVARSGGQIARYSAMYSDLGVAQSRVFPSGTVCITIAANIADSGVLTFEACFPDSVVGVQVERGFARPEYLEFFIRTAREDLARFAPATAQANINLGILSEVAVPLPPFDEMGVLTDRLQAAFSRAEHVQRQLGATRLRTDHLNQAILAKAFRGELVPQDPNDEPASVLLERIRAGRVVSAKPKPQSTQRRARTSKASEPPPEPEPPAAPTKPSAHKPQPDLPFHQDFLDLDPHEQAHAVATTLFGAGTIPKAEALRYAAEGLRTLGLSDHKRLRTGGKLHTALDRAITKGVRLGLFDRPARGQVRAIKPDATSYTPEDWRLCIDAVADEADDEDTLIRRAADWAQAQLGLSFARLRRDGHIYTGLRSAYRRRKDTAT